MALSTASRRPLVRSPGYPYCGESASYPTELDSADYGDLIEE
jgi:hypothetical protein